jgi:predicted nucleic acid-binding protein
MTAKYVFDTYAIMEIIQGNENYEEYLDSDVIINNFIFAELCYNLYKDKTKNASEIINKYSKHISSLNPEWIEEAMKFRLSWKDRGVSMTDCISYIMAKHLGIKFLTGDKEFENVENVEFVK